jgi:hypothetical protein
VITKENEKPKQSTRNAAIMLFLIMSLGGCGHRFSSIEQLVATQTQKENLLSLRVERFNRNVYWGGLNDAAEFVAGEARQPFFQEAQRRKKEEKIVDLEVTSIEFVNDGNTAEVVVQTRYFPKKGAQYVTARQERQVWQFYRMSDGWMYHGSEPLDDENLSAATSPLEERGRSMLKQAEDINR